MVKESTKARVRFQEKEGQKGIICEGIPCIDGNCVDHRFLTNGEMMDSISKLYAVSEMKAGDGVKLVCLAARVIIAVKRLQATPIAAPQV